MYIKKKITLHYDYETVLRGKLNYHKFSRAEKSQLALNRNSYIRNPEILSNTSVSFMYKLKKNSNSGITAAKKR